MKKFFEKLFPSDEIAFYLLFTFLFLVISCMFAVGVLWYLNVEDLKSAYIVPITRYSAALKDLVPVTTVLIFLAFFVNFATCVYCENDKLIGKMFGFNCLFYLFNFLAILIIYYGEELNFGIDVVWLLFTSYIALATILEYFKPFDFNEDLTKIKTSGVGTFII